jgi:hypothetical protein
MIYNQLSGNYNSLYLKNIISFKENLIRNNCNNFDYIDFYPSFGVKKGEYSDFLVYGQATNGWTAGFDHNTPIDDSKLNESIFASNKYYSKKDHSPLDWVNVRWSKSSFKTYKDDSDLFEHYDYIKDYWANKSFFWNVVYKLISKYYGFSRWEWDWSKKVIWSNLYKIAPQGKNPDYWEKEYQKPVTFELLKAEITELNPKFCIVLTNIEWWKPFGEYLNTEKIDYQRKNIDIESVEKYNNTLIVVTKRPFRGNSDSIAEQIMDVIK